MLSTLLCFYALPLREPTATKVLVRNAKRIEHKKGKIKSVGKNIVREKFIKSGELNLYFRLVFILEWSFVCITVSKI